jgi:hypothetical protein
LEKVSDYIDDTYGMWDRFYVGSTDDELISVIEEGMFIDDIPDAVYELNRRGHEGTRKLVQDIIDKDVGDELLVRWARSFLSSH